MPVIIDDTGGDGTAAGVEADATFLGSASTLYVFSADQVENAIRNTYRADESGVVFNLVISQEALKHPALVNTVAREWAATWNENARVPHVLEITETQSVTQLGTLVDVAEVLIESRSKRSTMVVEFPQELFRPDLFINEVIRWHDIMDANEATG